ncbi:hypothetical protein PPACK8108_LOCUS7921 [Phakopsora pachyrhizi]|uniref:FHA domain-containing protein n=1 Tax=Phakopsora pachyrhizi TaxID=170000 RepID=A0AAV0AVT9_PHAPC|nr:hypothetical protein PPACK8108_LOCUS7921 [Phakopsora pachyrhizi]
MILPGLIVGRRELSQRTKDSCRQWREAGSDWGLLCDARRSKHHLILKKEGGDYLFAWNFGGWLLIGALNKSNLPQSIGRQYELEIKNFIDDFDGAVNEENVAIETLEV